MLRDRATPTNSLGGSKRLQGLPAASDRICPEPKVDGRVTLGVIGKAHFMRVCRASVSTYHPFVTQTPDRLFFRTVAGRRLTRVLAPGGCLASHANAYSASKMNRPGFAGGHFV
jgi:hypothetical protein